MTIGSSVALDGGPWRDPAPSSHVPYFAPRKPRQSQRTNHPEPHPRHCRVAESRGTLLSGFTRVASEGSQTSESTQYRRAWRTMRQQQKMQRNITPLASSICGRRDLRRKARLRSPRNSRWPRWSRSPSPSPPSLSPEPKKAAGTLLRAGTCRCLTSERRTWGPPWAKAPSYTSTRTSQCPFPVGKAQPRCIPGWLRC